MKSVQLLTPLLQLIVLGVGVLLFGECVFPSAIAEETAKSHVDGEYTIATYYFPNYHVDPRNEAVHGKGWTEWELVQAARPRFPGHRQPRVPEEGYQDESRPEIMAQKINMAAEHNIDCFIFDWYYFDDGPFLDRCLDEGYLKAPNNDKVHFALMWANHDWKNIHPARVSEGVKDAPVLYPGPVTEETFDTICDLVIEKYFKHPSYWKIDGAPYFSFYELPTFVDGVGGVEKAAEALNRFREKVRRAGFPGVHLNAELEDISDLPEHFKQLGIDSVTNYNWGSWGEEEYPKANYAKAIEEAKKVWQRCETEYAEYFIPGVTTARDNSPRACQSDMYVNVGYPFNYLHYNSTPELFEKALREAKQFLDSQKNGRKILTLNAWNEWTEGAYLEPDSEFGMGYLEAVKKVFPR